jgi:aspartyl-tRNA(Asn)/glutamyl-tRNA(Gln) amidotransferase subunit B
LVEEGGRVVQETRGWVEERGVTVSQRTKEQAHDYRYFPEPDLPPLAIDPRWVEEIRAALPEMPGARQERFASQYGLPFYDANLLTATRAAADFFEACLAAKETPPDGLQPKAKAVANWMLGDLAGLLNASGLELEASKITPQHLREFTDTIETGTINGPAAKTVLEEMFASGKGARAIAEEQGLTQISDTHLVDGTVAGILEQNTQAVQDFLGGKETALKFLVGQVMKETRGRANPALVHQILLEKLGAKETL